MSAVRERPVQRNSQALGLGAEGQGFVVEVDFQLTLSFLVVEMEDRRHRFRGAGIHLALSCPWSAPLPPPANLHQHV